MRLWSLHPRFLDRQGLTACWREALLAQAVLAGRTRGYRSHPQLIRFRECDDALGAVGSFLTGIRSEAENRGYNYDGARILAPDRFVDKLPVTEGQLKFEWRHLQAKLAVRSPARANAISGLSVEPHPLFFVVAGPVALWERP